ncbi:hypothetical protein BC828DRAFT_409612 [Blastocladiella britannica]|nr:hypothetical protein BC828DRAFT_409612 [Blastocladiella britannica]
MASDTSGTRYRHPQNAYTGIADLPSAPRTPLGNGAAPVRDLLSHCSSPPPPALTGPARTPVVVDLTEGGETEDEDDYAATPIRAAPVRAAPVRVPSTPGNMTLELPDTDDENNNTDNENNDTDNEDDVTDVEDESNDPDAAIRGSVSGFRCSLVVPVGLVPLQS